MRLSSDAFLVPVDDHGQGIGQIGMERFFGMPHPKNVPDRKMLHFQEFPSSSSKKERQNRRSLMGRSAARTSVGLDCFEVQRNGAIPELIGHGILSCFG